MGEGIGYAPREEKTPTKSPLEALAAGLGVLPVDLQEGGGFPPGMLEEIAPDLLTGLTAAQTLPAKEVRVNDEYRVPNLAELINGGGNYWRPLFSTERAMLVQPDDDLFDMADKGLAHILTRRDSLGAVMENISTGEQTQYKALSARILEMTMLRSLIEKAQVAGNREVITPLLAGMDPEELLKQGEQLGLLKGPQVSGAIAAEADDIRQEYADPADRVVATLRIMEGRLGSVLKRPQTPIRNDTFLPHLSPPYSSAFGRYCEAKSVSPSPSAQPAAK